MSLDVLLLYCTLVPGMMSMGLILYEISSFVYLIWNGMEEFLYTEGIQLTAGRCSDLTQEEVLHLWRYNLYYQGKYFNEFSSRACWLSVL